MATPRKRRRSSAYRGATHQQHTSVPTGRAAYAETRQWLLATHGPVCAYCGRTFTARTLTLDHVTPRRGQHLSAGILDILRPMAGNASALPPAPAPAPAPAPVPGPRRKARHVFRSDEHFGVSPYRDEPSPYADESPKPEPARRPRRRGGGKKR